MIEEACSEKQRYLCVCVRCRKKGFNFCGFYSFLLFFYYSRIEDGAMGSEYSTFFFPFFIIILLVNSGLQFWICIRGDEKWRR